MTKKALRFDAGDNVAVALEAMSAGDRVLINGEDAGRPGRSLCSAAPDF